MFGATRKCIIALGGEIPMAKRKKSGQGQAATKGRSRSKETASTNSRSKKADSAKRKRGARLEPSDIVETDRSEADAVEFRKRKSEYFLGPFGDSFTQEGSNTSPPSDSWMKGRFAAAQGALAVSLIHMSGSSTAVVHHFARSGFAVPSEAEAVALLMWFFSASLATLTAGSAAKVIMKSPWLS
jgi:hypothetical protein